MENHDTSSFDQSLYQNWNQNGSPNGSVEKSTLISRRDYVYDYIKVEGDKKKPNNFAYRAMSERYWHGSVDWWFRFNNSWYISATRRGESYTNDGPTLSARALPAFERMQSFHYNRALSRLNEKVRGGLDLSVSLLEASEVKHMLLSAHKASNYIGNTIKGVKRGHKHDLLKDILKDGGSSFLQWHLGWEPLIKDLYASVGEVYRHLTDGMLDVSGGSTSYAPEKLLLTRTSTNDDLEYAQAFGKQGCKFHMRFQDKGGFDIRRYTSLNPVSILWERMPLSFVFDYFYDLGGLLRATETALLYDSQFVSGYYTELYVLSASAHRKGRSGQAADAYKAMDLRSDFNYKVFKRTVLGSYPLPRMPTFDVDLGSQQLLTIASLLAQKFL